MILVKYWAPWCGPCKPMTEVVYAVAEKYGFPVVEVNADEEPEMCIANNVMSLPTVLLLEDDGPGVRRSVGACGVAELEQRLGLV